MSGRQVTEELGMKLEKKDLEAWGGQQCVQCRKEGTGLGQGGTMLGKGPATEEMMQRGTENEGHAYQGVQKVRGNSTGLVSAASITVPDG